MLEEYNSVEEVENLSARVFTIVQCYHQPYSSTPRYEHDDFVLDQHTLSTGFSRPLFMGMVLPLMPEDAKPCSMHEFLGALPAQYVYVRTNKLVYGSAKVGEELVLVASTPFGDSEKTMFVNGTVISREEARSRLWDRRKSKEKDRLTEMVSEAEQIIITRRGDWLPFSEERHVNILV